MTMPLPIGRASSEPNATAPDGSEIRLLAGLAQGVTRASLCEVRLAPGAVSRPIRHRSVEEIWHVTAGRGQVWRCRPSAAESSGAADVADVCAGDTLVIPVGWAFQFRAERDAALQFLCFTSPPWPGPDEAEPAGRGGLGDPTV